MLHGSIENVSSVSARQYLSSEAAKSTEHEHLAQRAYVVLPRGSNLPLRLIVRGGKDTFAPGTTYQGTPQAVASRLNRRLGVSAAAARALFIDWQCDFKNTPVDPDDYSAYLSDCRLKSKAKRGSFSPQAASGGYLRFLTGTHGLPLNDQIAADSIRFIWLMAVFELEWAAAHGRTDVRDMLPTERAAHRLSSRTSAYQMSINDYVRRYSRFQQVLLAEVGDTDGAARIAARRRDPERRELLMEVRGRRRSAFKALSAAIRTYKRTRAELETA